MATIRKRGPHQWEARIRKKGHPTQSKTHETKKEAEDWARDIESEMGRGVFICRKEAENTTLAEALERYAREITVDKKGAPQELRRIEAWKRHPLSNRFLATLRGVDFAQYRDDRQAQGKSPSTIRLELAIISHLFNIAHKEWGMESLANPVQAIRLPSVGRARDRRLQDGEEARLLDAARISKSNEIGNIIIMALETGARRSELVKMHWEYINLTAKTWHIPKTKNGDARTVPLSSRAKATLQGLPRRIDGQVWAMSHADGITQAFDRVCKRAGIEGLRFHDLRHEATSRFFELGTLGIMEVASITGHKDLQMLKRYTHLRAEDLAVKLG